MRVWRAWGGVWPLATRLCALGAGGAMRSTRGQGPQLRVARCRVLRYHRRLPQWRSTGVWLGRVHRTAVQRASASRGKSPPGGSWSAPQAVRSPLGRASRHLDPARREQQHRASLDQRLVAGYRVRLRGGRQLQAPSPARPRWWCTMTRTRTRTMTMTRMNRRGQMRRAAVAGSPTAPWSEDRRRSLLLQP